MIPDASDDNTFWEHIHRYRFACQFCKGKRVLDIACGEGYGSAALTSVGACSVIGVDISPEAVAHAKAKYGINAIIGSAEAIPVETGSIDLVVSFETIEHVPSPSKFIQEIRRVLAPGGKLVISTPNVEVYGSGNEKNPFHCSEMSKREFMALLNPVFSTITLHAQCRKLPELDYLFESIQKRLHLKRQFGRERTRKILRSLFPQEDRPRSDAPSSEFIALINKTPGYISRCLDPMAIWPESKRPDSNPVYLIAVASLP